MFYGDVSGVTELEANCQSSNNIYAGQDAGRRRCQAADECFVSVTVLVLTLVLLRSKLLQLSGQLLRQLSSLSIVPTLVRLELLVIIGVRLENLKSHRVLVKATIYNSIPCFAILYTIL
jgi:hypothetical protein